MASGNRTNIKEVTVTKEEFLTEYGTKGWRLPIDEFIRRSPLKDNDVELERIVVEILDALEAMLAQ